MDAVNLFPVWFRSVTAMQKNALLTHKIAPNETPVIKKGDHIKHGEPVIAVGRAEVDQFNLAKLLGVNAKDVSKFLKVKPDSEVGYGQVLALKGGMLKKRSVKSPVSGKFVWVDKEKGLVGIEKIADQSEIKAWFDGEVKEVTDEKIVFEVSGVVHLGKEGAGGPASGKLYYIPHEITSLTLPIDLDGAVIVLKQALSDTIAKADALGAKAVITESIEEPEFALPYILVEDIGDFSRYNGKTVIVNGKEKEALILETNHSTQAKTHEKS